MANKAVRLEVFPEKPRLRGDAPKYHVRFVAGNGSKLMTTQGYESSGTRSNGIRAARTINKLMSATQEMPNGRFPIWVLDQAGNVDRIIEPLVRP